MNIAVVGAGAIGGFLAAALARSQADVAVVARGAHFDAIAREGLCVAASDLGAFAAKVRPVRDLREIDKIDIAFCAFKAHQWPDLLEQMQLLSASRATVVTLQNGVPFWFDPARPLRTVDPGGRIAGYFPNERVVGGVVHVSGTVVAPGKIEQSGGTRYVLGAPPGGNPSRVHAVASLLKDSDLQPEIDENIRETVWLKLVNNAGLNPVSALARLTIHAMLENETTRSHVRALMAETLAVGQALGVVSAVDLDARIAYARRLADVRTSMLQDLEAGRPLELEPIVGAPIELADRSGVPVPHLRDIYSRLRAVTSA